MRDEILFSIKFGTRKGTEYMDITLPRVESMYISEKDIADALTLICKEEGIEIIKEEDVPFPYNEHWN